MEDSGQFYIDLNSAQTYKIENLTKIFLDTPNSEQEKRAYLFGVLAGIMLAQPSAAVIVYEAAYLYKDPANQEIPSGFLNIVGLVIDVLKATPDAELKARLVDGLIEAIDSELQDDPLPLSQSEKNAVIAELVIQNLTHYERISENDTLTGLPRDPAEMLVEEFYFESLRPSPTLFSGHVVLGKIYGLCMFCTEAIDKIFNLILDPANSLDATTEKQHANQVLAQIVAKAMGKPPNAAEIAVDPDQVDRLQHSYELLHAVAQLGMRSKDKDTHGLSMSNLKIANKVLYVTIPTLLPHQQVARGIVPLGSFRHRHLALGD